jgi:segregation and condensation protein B
MVMRLVPREELLTEEDEIQALEEQALQAEQGRRRAAGDDVAAADAAAGEDAGERQDGAVDDDAPDEGPGTPAGTAEGEPSSADVPEINLPLLEALLLGTHHPLTAGRLAELLELDSTKPLRKAVRALNDQYQAGGRSFRVEQVAGGYQILTLPEFGDALKKLHQREADAKLTKAALETLAIVAYKQPILRADVEAIRGVACGETIRSLMEKHLVKIAGRAELPGRPILYGTTKRFLELFGLNSLKDLPQSAAIKPPAQG